MNYLLSLNIYLLIESYSENSFIILKIHSFQRINIIFMTNNRTSTVPPFSILIRELH